LKLAFEEVGRKLRHHIVRVMARRDRERRADLLIQYSRILARSLTNIERTDPQISKQQLATLPQQLEALITKLVGVESSAVEKGDEVDEVAAE